MNHDESHRQKMLARKRARRASRIAKRSEGFGRARVFESALRGASILQCLMGHHLFHVGIAHVIVSRRATDGSVVVSAFFVDVLSVGVRDTFYGVGSVEEYRGLLKTFQKATDLHPIGPACARKFVEGAVAYAEALGLSPHKNYEMASLIFGPIDQKECNTEFTYGDSGKPHFIVRPNDPPERVEEVLTALRKHSGEGNFLFSSHSPAAPAIPRPPEQ